MTAYDPNSSPEYTPPGAYGPTPTTPLPGLDAQPTTGADRWALVALTISLTVILSCVPGLSCLAPLVAGIIALMQAKNAADPQRARTYGWIATAIGGLILLAGLAFVALYGAIIVAALGEANNGDF